MTLGTPLAAAILTGGRARRLGGADKSALRVGGRAILARQLDVLRTVTPHVFVVGRAPLDLPAGIDVVFFDTPDPLSYARARWNRATSSPSSAAMRYHRTARCAEGATAPTSMRRR